MQSFATFLGMLAMSTSHTLYKMKATKATVDITHGILNLAYQQSFRLVDADSSASPQERFSHDLGP